MSKLIVTITPIKEINVHPNADKLVLATIKGWQVCVSKDAVVVGDLVVFIPPDSVLPETLHTHLGITKYLAELPKGYGGVGETERSTSRRVKAARLRGQASYGTIMTMDSFCSYVEDSTGTPPNFWAIQEGEDVQGLLAITKWEPPEKIVAAGILPDHVDFPKYTDIENIANYPDIFVEGEEVVITEKIHGTNCRVGAVHEADDDGVEQFTVVAGSHNTRRECSIETGGLYSSPLVWNEGLELMLRWDVNNHPMVIYGEIYGSGIQDMDYGMEYGKRFRVFDMAVKGDYFDVDDLNAYAKKFNITLVPELYRGPFSHEIVKQYTDGPTTIAETDKIGGKFKGREGVVIRPVKERYDPVIGRVILKSVSVDYLSRKGGTDGH